MTNKAKEAIERLNNHVSEIPFAEQEIECCHGCEGCIYDTDHKECCLSELD